jgi:hypothetical protein
LTRLARLGGYLDRTRDPPPGNNMVLWRGMTRLTDIHLGYTLAKVWVIERFAGRLPIDNNVDAPWGKCVVADSA